MAASVVSARRGSSRSATSPTSARRASDGRRGRGKQVPRELTLHVEELLGEIEDVVDDLVGTRDVARAVVPGRECRGLLDRLRPCADGVDDGLLALARGGEELLLPALDE